MELELVCFPAAGDGAISYKDLLVDVELLRESFRRRLDGEVRVGVGGKE